MMWPLQEWLYAVRWAQVQAGIPVNSGSQSQTQASLVEGESESQRKDPKQTLKVTMQGIVSNHGKQPTGE